MSLLSSYSAANCLTSSGLSITYRQQRVENDGSSNGYHWEISRFAKKQYSFVGMDKATAYACAAAKRSQYTRSFSRVVSSTSGSYTAYSTDSNINECPSDIAPQHDEGNAWSVAISVNETDTKYSASSVADPASLFATENARNYDEDATDPNSLTLLTASRVSGHDDQLAFTYSQTISGFDPDRLTLQYKTSESSTTWSRTTPTGANPSPVEVPSTGALYVRLAYGQYTSNTLTVAAP